MCLCLSGSTWSVGESCVGIYDRLGAYPGRFETHFTSIGYASYVVDILHTLSKCVKIATVVTSKSIFLTMCVFQEVLGPLANDV